MSPHIHYSRFRCIGLVVIGSVLALAGCSSVPQSASTTTVSSPKASSTGLPALPPAGSGRGGYYMDDGPGDAPPEDLIATPDAEPQTEPYSKSGNRPYVVFGKKYTPIIDERPFKQRGIGSWYGKKFHGQKTSSGERYDMYKMTAAHPTLPIPSYIRVTNLSNGKQVIVRVNDRGPFHASRIIDLSYTAALKLGYLAKGSSELEVERLLPEEIASIASRRKQQQATPATDVIAATVAADAVRVNVAGDTPILTVTVDRQADVSPSDTAIVASIPTTPAAAVAQGFYLQLGTYTQAGNAESARARLVQNTALALPPVEVVEYGLFYRLYSGPFASRADAAMAALRLQEAGAKPLIVQR